jgi:long-chain acyl-CoA synthetase
MDHPTLSAAERSSSLDWRRSWEDHYPCDRSLSLPYPKAPVTVLLEHAARRFPDRTACSMYGHATSYTELQNEARRMAKSLQGIGAGPGRYVAVLLPNMTEHAIALHAAWLTGVTVLQLSPLMVPSEVNHWLKATGCTTIITLDLLAPLVRPALEGGALEHVVVATLRHRLAVWRGLLYRVEHYRRNHCLSLVGAKIHPFEGFLHSDPMTDQPNVRPEEDVAMIVPTGGTTASPKAVMLTHRNLVANALQLRERSGGPDGGESALGVLPFFHAYGLSVCLLGSLAKGCTLHVLPRFEARAVRDLIARYRLDLLPLVPAMMAGLNAELRRRPLDLSFVRGVVSGASALPPALRAAFEAHNVRDVVEGYGLSEASPVTHVNPLGGGNKPGTIGFPLADTEARIVDPETGDVELPDGETGELVVRGPQVMKGYFENPQATALALRGGWLHTGDLAKRDNEGYYTIVDRQKDIIKTSGFLVYPAEVEEVLLRFPTVAEAAVIGEPDEERGELIRALIVPRNGSMDVAALERFCADHLGKHKRPKHYEVVKELPKNFLGKVLRRKLRERN